MPPAPVDNEKLTVDRERKQAIYSHLHEGVEMQLAEAERVGVGFNVPCCKCSKNAVEAEVAVAA